MSATSPNTEERSPKGNYDGNVTRRFSFNLEPSLHSRKRFVEPVTLGKKIGLLQELKHEEEVIKFLGKPYISEVYALFYLLLSDFGFFLVSRKQILGV